MKPTDEQIKLLLAKFNNEAPELLLKCFLSIYGERIALASSMGPEDHVLTDMLVKLDPAARVFTIDTGRLFPETYWLIDKTNMKYGMNIEVYFPDHKGVEEYVHQNGINGFYESIDKRKACCHARKLEPLQRVLATLDVWICGLRNEQSVTRTDTQMIEWDENNGLIKINPLIHWTEQQVWDYINENSVPYNVLHKSHYPSIGCQPCTRAVNPGEDVRSGRWWWENPDHKECGLHRR